MKRIASIFVLLSALLIAGCSSMYYGALEQVGIHKRELLVDRVEAAQESDEVRPEAELRLEVGQLLVVVPTDGQAQRATGKSPQLHPPIFLPYTAFANPPVSPRPHFFTW